MADPRAEEGEALTGDADGAGELELAPGGPDAGDALFESFNKSFNDDNGGGRLSASSLRALRAGGGVDDDAPGRKDFGRPRYRPPVGHRASLASTCASIVEIRDRRSTYAGTGGMVFHAFSTSHQVIVGAGEGAGGGAGEGVGEDGNGRPPERPSQTRHQMAISLPQSTHSWLFTEPLGSAPHCFALAVVAVSLTCLGLALSEGLKGGPANHYGIPANVPFTTHVGGYFAILIGALMEEEIPTALYLLRVIPRSSVEGLGLSKSSNGYYYFVFSAVCRLAIGYMFLANVFFVIVQSEEVLDMFYDMLALQFISMIDDISFRLAQLDILGKTLREAAASESFQTEIERKPYFFRKKTSIFTKCLFFVNLLILFALVLVISLLQRHGFFHCNLINVAFGDEVWERALVVEPGDTLETRFLAYPFFNGVYRKVDGPPHHGRPVYRELRKSSVNNYAGNAEEDEFKTRKGAEIKYCDEGEGFWMLTHTNIIHTNITRESSMDTNHDSSCIWLLRSPDTKAFDLMELAGDDWMAWVGVIHHGIQVGLVCNKCTDDTSCNLNGMCTEGACECTNKNYYGFHCELEAPCPRIISGRNNRTWTARLSPTRYCPGVGESTNFLFQYGRAMYTLDRASLVPGVGDFLGLTDNDRTSLVFSGNRWLLIIIEGAEIMNRTEIERIESEYHGFWDQAFKHGQFNYHDTPDAIISGPTSGSTPAGVDFFSIGPERGDHLGPFGVLYPHQNPPGKYPFRCVRSFTKADAVASCMNSTYVNLLG